MLQKMILFGLILVSHSTFTQNKSNSCSDKKLMRRHVEVLYNCLTEYNKWNQAQRIEQFCFECEKEINSLSTDISGLNTLEEKIEALKIQIITCLDEEIGGSSSNDKYIKMRSQLLSQDKKNPLGLKSDPKLIVPISCSSNTSFRISKDTTDKKAFSNQILALRQCATEHNKWAQLNRADQACIECEKLLNNLGPSISSLGSYAEKLEAVKINVISCPIEKAEKVKSEFEMLMGLGKTHVMSPYNIAEEIKNKKENTNHSTNQNSNVVNETNTSNNNSNQLNLITKVYSDGIFWGNFKNDKREGFGIYEGNDGWLYEGNYSNDLKNGYGVYYSSNGDRYEGNWVDDKRQGQGTYYFSNGDRFVGQFSNGQKTDQGTYSWSVDKKGCLSGDCNNGFGKKAFPNALYEGNFVNGKENGKGKMTYSNKCVYDGEWKDGMKHGKGKQTWYSGAIYEGDFINDKKHGKGKYTWGRGNSEGSVYEGDFVDGKRTGVGKLTSIDGTVQEGNFVDNKFTGNVSSNSLDSSTETTENKRRYNLTQSNENQSNKTKEIIPVNCPYTFSIPNNLKVDIINNCGTVCCLCGQKNRIVKTTFSNNDLIYIEKAHYLNEKLYLHLKEVNADVNHIEYDIKRLQDYLQQSSHAEGTDKGYLYDNYPSSAECVKYFSIFKEEVFDRGPKTVSVDEVRCDVYFDGLIKAGKTLGSLNRSINKCNLENSCSECVKNKKTGNCD